MILITVLEWSNAVPTWPEVQYMSDPVHGWEYYGTSYGDSAYQLALGEKTEPFVSVNGGLWELAQEDPTVSTLFADVLMEALL